MASRAFLASRDYLSLDKSKLEGICRTILANSVLILKVEGIFATFPQWITFLREFFFAKIFVENGEKSKGVKKLFWAKFKIFLLIKNKSAVKDRKNKAL